MPAFRHYEYSKLDLVTPVPHYLYQNLKVAASWACVRIIGIFLSTVASLEKYPVVLYNSYPFFSASLTQVTWRMLYSYLMYS